MILAACVRCAGGTACGRGSSGGCAPSCSCKKTGHEGRQEEAVEVHLTSSASTRSLSCTITALAATSRLTSYCHYVNAQSPYVFSEVLINNTACAASQLFRRRHQNKVQEQDIKQ